MNFCLNCGKPLDAVSNADTKTEILTGKMPSAPPTSNAQKSNKLLWIFGILAVLFGFGIAIAASIHFIVNLPDSNANTPKDDNSAAKVKTPDTAKPTPSPKKSNSPLPVNANAGAPDASASGLSNDNSNAASTGDDVVFRVKANQGWQPSNIEVVRNDRFRMTASGEISVRGILKAIPPDGISGNEHRSRRIFKEFPTGALLMRTRFPEGRFSNISVVGTNSANKIWGTSFDEYGKLEFCVNDNSSAGNSGEFVVNYSKVKTP